MRKKREKQQRLMGYPKELSCYPKGNAVRVGIDRKVSCLFLLYHQGSKVSNSVTFHKSFLEFLEM